MRKFTYSRQLGQETFTAVEFDSFDEARRSVDKAIHERKLEIEKEKAAKQPTQPPTTPAAPEKTGDSTTPPQG